MKRVFVLSMPMLMLTLLLVYRPQPSADGQTSVAAPQDTARRKPMLADTIDLTHELDSNRRILTEIQGNVQGIKRGVTELVRDRRAERRQAAAERSAKADTVKDTVRVAYTVRVPIPYEQIDSEMVGKTWFGQMRVHISRCRINKLFKPKQWGKGKF